MPWKFFCSRQCKIAHDLLLIFLHFLIHTFASPVPFSTHSTETSQINVCTLTSGLTSGLQLSAVFPLPQNPIRMFLESSRCHGQREPVHLTALAHFHHSRSKYLCRKFIIIQDSAALPHSCTSSYVGQLPMRCEVWRAKELSCIHTSLSRRQGLSGITKAPGPTVVCWQLALHNEISKSPTPRSGAENSSAILSVKRCFNFAVTRFVHDDHRLRPMASPTNAIGLLGENALWRTGPSIREMHSTVKPHRTDWT